VVEEGRGEGEGGERGEERERRAGKGARDQGVGEETEQPEPVPLKSISMRVHVQRDKRIISGIMSRQRPLLYNRGVRENVKHNRGGNVARVIGGRRVVGTRKVDKSVKNLVSRKKVGKGVSEGKGAEPRCVRGERRA
jgi:hypothetical protein